MLRCLLNCCPIFIYELAYNRQELAITEETRLLSMGTTNSVLSKYGSIRKGTETDRRHHQDSMSDTLMSVRQRSSYQTADDATLRSFQTALSYAPPSATNCSDSVAEDRFESNESPTRTILTFGNDLGIKLARYCSILVGNSASMEQMMTALEGMYDIRPMPCDVLGFRFVFPQRNPSNFTGSFSNSWNCIRVPFSVPSDTSRQREVVYWTESLWTEWFGAMLGSLKSSDGVLVRTSLRILAKLFETSPTYSQLGNSRFQPIAEPPLDSLGGYFDRFVQKDTKQKKQDVNPVLPNKGFDGSEAETKPVESPNKLNDTSEPDLSADTYSNFFEQVCFSITSSHFVEVMSVPLVEDNIFARRDAVECIHVLHLALGYLGAPFLVDFVVSDISKLVRSERSDIRAIGLTFMTDLYASCVPLHNAGQEASPYDIEPFVEAACSGINDNTSEKIGLLGVRLLSIVGLSCSGKASEYDQTLEVALSKTSESRYIAEGIKSNFLSTRKPVWKEYGVPLQTPEYWKFQSQQFDASASFQWEFGVLKKIRQSERSELLEPKLSMTNEYCSTASKNKHSPLTTPISSCCRSDCSVSNSSVTSAEKIQSQSTYPFTQTNESSPVAVAIKSASLTKVSNLPSKNEPTNESIYSSTPNLHFEDTPTDNSAKFIDKEESCDDFSLSPKVSEEGLSLGFTRSSILNESKRRACSEYRCPSKPDERITSQSKLQTTTSFYGIPGQSAIESKHSLPGLLEDMRFATRNTNRRSTTSKSEDNLDTQLSLSYDLLPHAKTTNKINTRTSSNFQGKNWVDKSVDGFSSFSLPAVARHTDSKTQSASGSASLAEGKITQNRERQSLDEDIVERRRRKGSGASVQGIDTTYIDELESGFSRGKMIYRKKYGHNDDCRGRCLSEDVGHFDASTAHMSNTFPTSSLPHLKKKRQTPTSCQLPPRPSLVCESLPRRNASLLKNKYGSSNETKTNLKAPPTFMMSRSEIDPSDDSKRRGGSGIRGFPNSPGKYSYNSHESIRVDNRYHSSSPMNASAVGLSGDRFSVSESPNIMTHSPKVARQRIGSSSRFSRVLPPTSPTASSKEIDALRRRTSSSASTVTSSTVTQNSGTHSAAPPISPKRSPKRTVPSGRFGHPAASTTRIDSFKKRHPIAPNDTSNTKTKDIRHASDVKTFYPSLPKAASTSISNPSIAPSISSSQGHSEDLLGSGLSRPSASPHSSFSPHAKVPRSPDIPPLSKMSVTSSSGLLTSSYQSRGRTFKPRVLTSKNNSPVAHHFPVSPVTPRYRADPISDSPFRESLRSIDMGMPQSPSRLPLNGSPGSPPYALASTESLVSSRYGNALSPLSEGAGAGKFVQNVAIVKEEVEAESSTAMSLENPIMFDRTSVKIIADLKNATKWDAQVSGLQAVESYAVFNRNWILSQDPTFIATLGQLLAPLVSSLRSQVSKQALQTVRMLFYKIGGTKMDSLLPLLFPACLKRAADLSNTFLSVEADKTLIAISAVATPSRIVNEVHGLLLKRTTATTTKLIPHVGMKLRGVESISVVLSRSAETLIKGRHFPQLVKLLAQVCSDVNSDVRSSSRLCISFILRSSGSWEEFEALARKHVNSREMSDLRSASQKSIETELYPSQSSPLSPNITKGASKFNSYDTDANPPFGRKHSKGSLVSGYRQLLPSDPLIETSENDGSEDKGKKGLNPGNKLRVVPAPPETLSPTTTSHSGLCSPTSSKNRAHMGKNTKDSDSEESILSSCDDAKEAERECKGRETKGVASTKNLSFYDMAAAANGANSPWQFSFAPSDDGEQ